MSFHPGERSMDDVHNLVKLSKLPTSNLDVQEVRCIFFGDRIQRDDIVLFEMDKETLNNISCSENVCIKGREDQTAVLVTDERTYDVKECETSNTTLMLSGRLYGGKNEGGEMRNGVDVRKVEGVKRNHYELKECLPRMALLRQMLDEQPYSGGLVEGGHSFEELLRVVQCSRRQLQQALCKNNACLIHGKWWRLEFDFLCQCFRHVIASVDECGYDDDDDISMEMIRRSMLGVFNEDVTKYMLARFMVPVQGDSCRFDEREVCTMYALMMLVHSPKFLLEDFEEAWKLCVPRGMKPEYSFLKGVVVVEGHSRPPVVRYLPASELPDELAARLKVLFNFKDKWTMKGIEPYLEDMCVGASTVTSLLLKHTRMSSCNGTKVFSCKKF